MKVITNNIPRNFLSWDELTPKEQELLDWIEITENQWFIRYRGWIYPLSEFMVAPKTMNWDGIYEENAFSGILIKLMENKDQVIMGRYYS